MAPGFAAALGTIASTAASIAPVAGLGLQIAGAFSDDKPTSGADPIDLGSAGDATTASLADQFRKPPIGQLGQRLQPTNFRDRLSAVQSAMGSRGLRR